MSNTKSNIESVVVREHIAQISKKAKSLFARSDEPIIIVSPYRMNPLGAHIDHQGGSVLARTIDQYTVLALYPATTPEIELHSESGEQILSTKFDLNSDVEGANWERYAKASAKCFASLAPKANGFTGLVVGTLVGAGLSSSASVILAYLMGLATANNFELKDTELVELSRQVENVHMGLNNGLQDQMSIVFGRTSGLSLLDMSSVSAEYFANPTSMSDVCWVVCYSGYSRELVSSGFNDRVRECREAATLLDSNASHLGEVALAKREQSVLDTLPDHLACRAQHVYSEMQRVEKGCEAWANGQWEYFGKLMNQSCHSSIHQYECGSEPMIALHEIALQHGSVYGSRFGGGGYGGCLMMLVKISDKAAVQTDVLSAYIKQFPEKQGIAKIFIAQAEENVRVVDSSVVNSGISDAKADQL